MKTLLKLLCLLVSTSLWAQVWSPVFVEPDEVRFGFREPIITDKFIIFENRTDEFTYGIWSHDINTGETQLLSPEVSPTYRRGMVYSDGWVYFLYNEGAGSQLWQTDGTTEGTARVSDMTFIPVSYDALAVHDGSVFLFNSDQRLVEYDGNQLISHGPVSTRNPDLDNICRFADQELLVLFGDDNHNLLKIGQQGVEDLSDYLPQRAQVSDVVSIDGHCYVHFTLGGNINDLPAVLRVSADGEAQFLTPLDDPNPIVRVLQHQGQKYGFINVYDNGFRLTKLVTLTDEDEQRYVVVGFVGSAYVSHQTLPHQLFLELRGVALGDRSLYAMDDVEQIRELDEQYSSGRSFISGGQQSSAYIPEPERYSDAFDVKLFGSDGSRQLTATGFIPSGIYHQSGGDQAYYLLSHRKTGQQGIYVLSDEAVVSPALSGLWYDPALENQGLFLKPGTRADGSQYVSVTLYTFRNGEPLWLAGNTDYLPGQSALSLQVFEFQGGDFLSEDQPPQAALFGTLTISPQACDELTAVITGEATHALHLQRFQNSLTDRYCLTEATQAQ
jgi:ELWxxDGT repeat protein